MKALQHELKLLKFELWQCQDIVKGKLIDQPKAIELKKRIKSLENVLRRFH
jgi:hypothetical protein